MKITTEMSRVELVNFLSGLFPLEVDLPGAPDDQPEKHWLKVHVPKQFEMVPEKGVRIITSATLIWPIPVIKDEIRVREIRALIVPTVEQRGDEWALVFRFMFEGVDVAFLPGVLGKTVANQINRAVKKADVEIAWEYTETLRVHIDLPEEIKPVCQFRLGADPAKLTIGESGLRIDGNLTLCFARDCSDVEQAE